MPWRRRGGACPPCGGASSRRARTRGREPTDAQDRAEHRTEPWAGKGVQQRARERQGECAAANPYRLQGV
eukprot:1541270-Lingulodinium_polyedra.AAC.1